MAELLGVQGNAWSGTPLPRVFASEIRHGSGTNRRSLRMPSVAARPRLPDSVGCDGFSVRRAFPVRCLSAVIRLAVLGKVGSRLAGTDVGMLPREAVACLDLLPGDRLRRTFGTAVFPDFLVCRVTRGDKAGLRLADDTPERTTVRLSEIGLLLVLDLLPLVVGRVGRYSENYGRIPHGRRIGRRRGGGQSPCDQQRPDVGIASPEIPVQRGSRLGGAPLENVSPVGSCQARRLNTSPLCRKAS